EIACSTEAAAQHERLGIEDLHEVGDADAGEPRRGVDDAEILALARTRLFEGLQGAGRSTDDVRRVARHGSAGRDRLEAAGVPVAAQWSSGQQGHVTYLPRQAVGATDEPVAKEEPPTDTRRQRYVDAGVELTRGAVKVLGVAG